MITVTKCNLSLSLFSFFHVSSPPLPLCFSLLIDYVKEIGFLITFYATWGTLKMLVSALNANVTQLALHLWQTFFYVYFCFSWWFYGENARKQFDLCTTDSSINIPNFTQSFKAFYFRDCHGMSEGLSPNHLPRFLHKADNSWGQCQSLHCFISNLLLV